MADILNLPPSFDPLSVKRGFNLAAPPETITPDNYGTFRIETREVERLEISFDPHNPPTPPFRKGGEESKFFRKEGEETDSAGKRGKDIQNESFNEAGGSILYAGYMIVGDELRPLPIGSTLDARTGTFSWMPGPGFVGEYNLIFVVEDEFGTMWRISLNVRIVPKT